ncbi:MAG: hypothetical protein H6696_20390 [Deferribacteres bacterium]|nr:hypothetical protein [candidate division KSB1 bacterium]MCB9504291.1 hypothetical protein [Deferribacteres bacterium]
MESIKQTFTTPKNHQIIIKIPAHIPENDPVEVVLTFHKKTTAYEQKINELKNAVNDKQFHNDLKQITKDFNDVDLNEWHE